MIALGAGLFGAGIVFLFLTRVLISHEENMDSADYEMVGVLGRISMPIRENGTGEIITRKPGQGARAALAAKTATPSKKARRLSSRATTRELRMYGRGKR